VPFLLHTSQSTRFGAEAVRSDSAETRKDTDQERPRPGKTQTRKDYDPQARKREERPSSEPWEDFNGHWRTTNAESKQFGIILDVN